MTLVLLSVVTRLPPASRTSTWTAGAIVAPGGVFEGGTKKASAVADPTATLKALEVSPTSTPDAAFNVYAVPALSMLRVPNVATPALAAWLTVPSRCAPAVPVPDVIPNVTVAMDDVRLPFASRIRTVTAGEIVAPPVVEPGCWPNASLAAAPTVMLNGLEMTLIGPVAEAIRVYPAPVLSMLRSENVATPLAAGTLRVPESVPLPGLAAMAIVTLSVNPVAVLPCASRAVTCMAGMIAPALVLVGGAVKTSWVAVPGEMLNVALVSEARLAAVARIV